MPFTAHTAHKSHFHNDKDRRRLLPILSIELEYTERLCYYVHGVRIENTPLPCLPAQPDRAGRKTNAAPAFSYESSVSPISMILRHEVLDLVLF